MLKAKEQVKTYDLGALLCFDFDNIRYITGTHVGEWARNKMTRHCILPVDSDPILFDSAAAAKRVTCPWIADRVFPAVGSMRGTIPPDVGMVEKLGKKGEPVSRRAKSGFQGPAEVGGAQGTGPGIAMGTDLTLSAVAKIGRGKRQSIRLGRHPDRRGSLLDS